MTPNQHTWESQATHAELRERFEGRWPAMRRRLRVEGTAAGNSRLLTRRVAERDASRYGGRAVEVVKLLPVAIRQALALPSCPTCKVGAGEPCTSRGEKVRRPHAARWVAHYEEADQ